MKDFNSYSLKAGAVMVMETRLSHFNCPYCEKTSDIERDVSTDRFYLDEKCPKCFFLTKLELSYIEEGCGIYVVSHNTNEVIRSMNEGKTLTYYHNKDLDKGPFAVWTDFLLNKLIVSNTDALLHSKHESKKVRDYCWSYLKSDKERKCL